MKQLTCIDLFCGCGGLSLGLRRAGLKVLAAIDVDESAIRTYQANLPKVPHVLHRDLTEFGPDQLLKETGQRDIDVIVGGPPCQGFSKARSRDGANSGPRLVEDPRRHLYKEFLRYVGFFRPMVFVIENVPGIKSAATGEYFSRIQREGRLLGYRVHGQEERAFDLGVPQKRLRQLIIGTRLDLASYFPTGLPMPSRAVPSPTLGEAIGDLPPLKAGEGTERSAYDKKRRKLHAKRYGRKFLYKTLEVGKASCLTAHTARPHSQRDLRDFGRLREGENSKEAMRRGEVFEFPYDVSSFKDRYTRQHRDELCSTIVAHLSKDGLMFIHPTQPRSLTAREAARVQSFPDWFSFPVARTHQFRLIGNAVPPLVGEALGLAIKAFVRHATAKSGRSTHTAGPGWRLEALQSLAEVVDAPRKRRLDLLSHESFCRLWRAAEFLFPELHPASALDHGTKTEVRPSIAGPNTTEEALAEVFVRSGWPVALRPLAREAWRRYQAGALTEAELYSEVAVRAGLAASVGGATNHARCLA